MNNMTPLPLRGLPSNLQQKEKQLQSILQEMRAVLVAFSGGIDSTLLLKMAVETLGDRAIGVVAFSPTFPEVEREEVNRLRHEIGAQLLTVETNQLNIPDFVRNDASRCYHCKIDLYRLFEPVMQQTGINTIVDGTNIDDLGEDRPGIQAAKEQGVRSPLLEAGFTKNDIRVLAHHLGLSNWDKPAAACLSSRIPRGSIITDTKLRRVEKAEALLKGEGFKQLRVRDHEGMARIEVAEREIERFFDQYRRERITRGLKQLGFRWVTLDLAGYHVGGGN